MRTFFSLGFRPFFLLGALFSVLLIGYFSLSISGASVPWLSAWDAISWHRHEMLFGYTAAIITGFLFTAVPNWTGHPTPKGAYLAAIVGLWIAGRVAVFTSTLIPTHVVVVIDCAFFLACVAGIFPALMKAHNKRNYFFIALLSMLATANALTHYGHADMGIKLGLTIIIFMMIVMGGRVIPMFTGNPLRLIIPRNPIYERVALIATLTALASDVLGAPAIFIGATCLIAALANVWRMAQWHSFKTYQLPLVWILHTGYAWLCVGFALKGLSAFDTAIPTAIATHAFTTGGIGALTLGMIARVSLGHSGRPLIVGKVISFAFLCVNLAALCRVAGVWAFPEFTSIWLALASIMWVLAFGMYIIKFVPVLIKRTSI